MGFSISMSRLAACLKRERDPRPTQNILGHAFAWTSAGISRGLSG
jgi:hypothetical protein